MEDVKLMYSIITDCWKIYKNNFPPQNNQKYWSDLTEQIGQLCDKYNHPFCDGMTEQIIQQLERDIKA